MSALGECPPDAHDWIRVDDGPRRFRFCGVCDREEHDSGVVRGGWDNGRTAPAQRSGEAR